MSCGWRVCVIESLTYCRVGEGGDRLLRGDGGEYDEKRAVDGNADKPRCLSLPTSMMKHLSTEPNSSGVAALK